MVASGDPVIVDQSGFPSYSTERVVDRSPPAAPTDVRLRHGDVPGSVLMRFKPARAKSFNRAQTCTGDPNVEANWHDAAFFPRRQIPLHRPDPRHHRLVPRPNRRPRRPHGRLERPGENYCGVRWGGFPPSWRQLNKRSRRSPTALWPRSITPR
jgi:hypothetical protein